MSFRDIAIRAARQHLPRSTRDWIVRLQRRYNLHWLRVGTIRFGDLHRTTPVSPVFALDRGLAIDRYYIAQFLGKHRADIRGRCLEFGDATYITQFGEGRATTIDVLHVKEGNPTATIVADLTAADHVPSDTFDCIIFTQVLQMIYDMKAAMRTIHRILKPGGVLLMTSHGISKIGRRLERDGWGEYWRLTAQSAELLLAETFPGAGVEVGTYGNVFATCCCLHGLAVEEIAPAELDYVDSDYEVIVTVRAVKHAPSA